MDRKRILLVTGMSGAGTSTTLKALEDLGWELVDNLPLFLLDSLLEAPPPAGMEGKNRPLAISLGVRTRDFDPEQIIERVRRLKDSPRLAIETLFLNCGGAELKRRYAETRHRHPLALDRAADDGIAHERAILAPLRDMADRLLDFRANLLNRQLAGGDPADNSRPVVDHTVSRGNPQADGPGPHQPIIEPGNDVAVRAAQGPVGIPNDKAIGDRRCQGE